MKKILIILFIGIISFIVLSAASGFELLIQSNIPIYASRYNLPLEDRAISAHLQPGDRVLSLNCYDIKSDLFFQVHLANGTIGYLYDFSYSSKKRLVPDLQGIQSFFKDPITSLQCLIMVPEYSKN